MREQPGWFKRFNDVDTLLQTIDGSVLPETVDNDLMKEAIKAVPPSSVENKRKSWKYLNHK